MEKTNTSPISPPDAVASDQNDHESISKRMDIIRGEESTAVTQETSGDSPILLSFIWLGMFLLAIAVSLAGQTVISYQPYALSEFNAHSMLSVIGTIQYILYVQAHYRLIFDPTADGLDTQLLSPLWQERPMYGDFSKHLACPLRRY